MACGVCARSTRRAASLPGEGSTHLRGCGMTAVGTFETCQLALICPVSGEDRKCPADCRNGAFDPNVWSGRALQEVFVDPAETVSHQCIRPLLGARCAPGHHGYQRACDLISGQASTGHLGHQCSHAPGRPILHHRLILSQTSAGRLSYVIDSSSFYAVPLFVPGGRSFVPACACRRAARRGRQGWPSRGPCLSRQRGQATP
jgi:hypothetical protein